LPDIVLVSRSREVRGVEHAIDTKEMRNHILKPVSEPGYFVAS
jgi:hypothetical protein